MVQVETYRRKARSRQSKDPIYERYDLPMPWEIPKVTKKQLQTLYGKFYKGIEDEELLDEVESRLRAREEVFWKLNNLWQIRDKIEVDKEDELNRLFDVYGMYISIGSGELSDAGVAMHNARGKDFRTRMIAVDSFISATHEGGPLADVFIEAKDWEDAVKFLDELSAGKLSGGSGLW